MVDKSSCEVGEDRVESREGRESSVDGRGGRAGIDRGIGRTGETDCDWEEEGMHLKVGEEGRLGETNSDSIPSLLFASVP